MANDLTAVAPKLLAQGLRALRQRAVTARLVNRDYDDMAAMKGQVINVPIPAALTATDVTPSATQPANVDVVPSSVPVTLDFWKESKFQMSDKDIKEAMDGTLPMQASEAIKAIGNAIDQYILGKYKGFWNHIGTAGTTPFNGSLTVAAQAGTVLDKELADLEERRMIVSPDARQNFLLNSNILQADQRGDAQGIIAGTIGTKLGFDWYMNQNVDAVTHTPGTAWITGWTSDASATVGTTTLAVVFTNSGTVLPGDIFFLTNGGLGYTVTATATAVTAATINISFKPGLRTAVATAASLFIGAGATAYVVNVGFHRGAIAWASRPLQDIQGLGNVIESVTDPVSGVSLRLEISRQNRQTTFAYDVLGGAGVVRGGHGVRIKG